jgi:hypothetical protein
MRIEIHQIADCVECRLEKARLSTKCIDFDNVAPVPETAKCEIMQQFAFRTEAIEKE